jgi:DNA-binding CsgD family transcriptional regulator
MPNSTLDNEPAPITNNRPRTVLRPLTDNPPGTAVASRLDDRGRCLIEFTGSRESIRRGMQAAFTAADEVVAVVPDPHLPSNFMETSRECDLLALRSGTRMRTIYHDDIANHLPSMQFVRDTIEAGAQARSLSVLPTWLTIIGRQLLLVPRSADAGALIIRGDSYVNAALWLFDRAWQEASPLARETESLSLTSWERKVLAQLIKGAKDESAARDLRVSPRTYRRHVAELCAHLGASSRFEAGARAARAGLI